MIEQLGLAEGRCRLRVADEMTIYVATALKQELIAALGGSDALEVDLSGVTEIDSAGFQLLALLKREAAHTGKRVAFVAHSPAVMRVMDLYDAGGSFGDPVVIPSGRAA